ncbi:MAG: hypothetical protein MZW92_42380 [Comamonadaceae bacterium]|nr:hypothetical protein [Comamonadaceae bacterium]
MIGPLVHRVGRERLRRGRGPLRRQPARRAELGLPDGAHRRARAPDALLPAREDLRAPARHGLQPGQRRDVLLPGRGDGHGERDGGGPLVRHRDAGPERRLPEQRRLGRDRPRHGRPHDRGRGVRLQGGGAHREHRRAVDGAGVHRATASSARASWASSRWASSGRRRRS